MPVDPATTTFNTPSIIGSMPRIFRVPTSGDQGTGGGNPPPTEGQLWPRGDK